MINLMENECWLCGSNKNITRHHALNKSWKPKKNVLIPLCDKCHRDLHHNQNIYMSKIVGKARKKTTKKTIKKVKRKLSKYSIRIDNTDNTFNIYHTNKEIKIIRNIINPNKNCKWVRM